MSAEVPTRRARLMPLLVDVMNRLALACLCLFLTAGAARGGARGTALAQPGTPQPPRGGTQAPAGQASQGFAPPVASVATAQTTPAAATPPSDAAQLLIFGSDVGIVINPIKPDRTADFELVMRRIQEALRTSADPVRQQQAASWKMLKAAEPGPAGSVLYVFLMAPPVQNADYTVSRILAEGFPLEVDDLWGKLRDAYAAPMHRLSLQTVALSPATGPSSR